MSKAQWVSVAALLVVGLTNWVSAQQGEPVVWIASSTQAKSPAYLDASAVYYYRQTN
jgi:hypothetical protein